MVFASTGSRGRTAVNNSNDIRISNMYASAIVRLLDTFALYFFFSLSCFPHISSHLSARNVDLLVAATLNLYYGRRYGLVGRNGVGKSTLMDRISRRLITGTDNELFCFNQYIRHRTLRL